ncbi:class I SAM-dependent methyltransferase [Cellulomonas sp. zg-ZUI199]|uniref:Class I SAM-dependent methyltransferase n=1 Tax=Cellulomonas wangleii TaxID=2816956 RepID=A0ABX8D2W4_9CELL|nr:MULTISPECIES: class I SAM-dependent methyltransferase [Cellulomonas]MBO0899259.1 class I SAM-dependent methyltransferase [Cellulomonas sp. zg-ZUI22]MBO0923461.1 class I SAM-dependent methyltransferase [Cellulomonas wangleii]QVI61806.1 class I SAM-dependent methyltransferase [Cellulomonas wangleii]
MHEHSTPDQSRHDRTDHDRTDHDRTVHDRTVHDLPEETLDPAWWEERYRSQDRLWSGRVNASLVQLASDLPPGTALDAGAGEGGDAVWLAERGWRVTAVDASRTALDRGAAEAARRGLDVTWVQADLRTWVPSQRYDLVTSHYLHAEGGRGWHWLADAVAPGGTLLVVGHDPSDLDGPVPRPHLARLGHTADQVAADLDPTQWASIEPQVLVRTIPHDGVEVTVRDAVLVARRR